MIRFNFDSSFICMIVSVIMISQIEETPDDCPNCLYQNKKAEKDPDECPNCYYIPNKEKKEGQE